MKHNKLIFIEIDSITSSDCNDCNDSDFDYQKNYLETIIKGCKNDKMNLMECYIDNLIEIEKMKDDFRNHRLLSVKT